MVCMGRGAETSVVYEDNKLCIQREYISLFDLSIMKKVDLNVNINQQLTLHQNYARVFIRCKLYWCSLYQSSNVNDSWKA